jgi:hypothetical protein
LAEAGFRQFVQRIRAGSFGLGCFIKGRGRLAFRVVFVANFPLFSRLLAAKKVTQIALIVDSQRADVIASAREVEAQDLVLKELLDVDIAVLWQPANSRGL